MDVPLIPAWLTKNQVSLAEIGLFALVGLPYNWKFVWAPLMDRYVPPLLGRRRGWLSNLHLAAREPRDGSFVMLGKTFKGMTDAMLTWQTKHLGALELGREGHVVHVKPETVVEIAFSNVQASPIYPAGMALRFARVKRYRPDKRAEGAGTIDAVRALSDVPLDG